MTRTATIAWLLAAAVVAVRADDLRDARDLARSGTQGVRVLAGLAGSPDPAERERAARALGDAGGALARSILARLLGDPDPAVRGAAVQSLLDRAPRKDGAEWVHDGAVALASARDKLDDQARRRLEPALQLAVSRRVLAGLLQLRSESEGIYFEQMFEPIGALGVIGERYLAEAFLRVLGQLDLGTDPIARHALADLAGKAIGDLRIASARPWLREIHAELVQKMGFRTRGSPLEDAVHATEIALYKLGDKGLANDRIRRLQREAFLPRSGEELASYYMRLGLYAEAIKIYEQNIATNRRFGSVEISHYNLACALSKSGQVDRGLEHLERAITGGYRNFEGIARDRDLDNLRADARFVPLIQRLRERK